MKRYLLLFLFFYVTIFSNAVKAQFSFTEENIQKLEKVFLETEQLLSKKRYKELNDIVDHYLDSNYFDSHHGRNLAEMIMIKEEMLEISEKLIKKCISENITENLKVFYPDLDENTISQSQNLDFSRIYFSYAWIMFKRKRYKEANVNINRGLHYQKKVGLKSDASDLIRNGIIKYYNDEKDIGWDLILESLLTDNQIEQQDTGYLTALNQIISQQVKNNIRTVEFIKAYREKNREQLPHFELTTIDEKLLNVYQTKERILFLIFFSPACGLCRKELPIIKELFDNISSRDEILLILILTNKNLKRESQKLINQVGFKNAIVYTVNNGSAWDYIRGELTIWIVDKNRKIAAKYLGYKDGDEKKYEKEIMNLK